MIFVGLAIITLIISFIIALISLIREQKQEAELEKEIEEPQVLIKDEVEQKLKENQILKDAQIEEKPKSPETEPFPWELDQPLNSIPDNLSISKDTKDQKDHDQLPKFGTQNQLSGTIFLKDAGAKGED